MANSIHAAATRVARGTLTPVDLVEDCLRRIDQYESAVCAWVLVDRDGALAQARSLTEELRRGQHRGPLHGIPLGIKDIFDVVDWPTGCGTRLLAQSIARRDATVV